MTTPDGSDVTPNEDERPPEFNLSQHVLAQYRELRYDPEAECQLGLSQLQALCWNDEHPGRETNIPCDVDPQSRDSLIQLLAARRYLWFRGEVPALFRPLWDKAMREIPDWPGFRRLSVSDNDRAVMQGWSDALDRAERAYERLDRLQRRAREKAKAR